MTRDAWARCLTGRLHLAAACNSRCNPLPPTPTPAPVRRHQVTVAPNANIIGLNIRDTGFRGRFDAAVIAVKRNNVKQARCVCLWGGG